MAPAVAVAAALLIGLSLGAVGGGGSILAVPVLVGLAGLSPEEATTSSLVVVGVASLVGVLSPLRSGGARPAIGLAFGAAGVGGALVGTELNRAVSGDALLVGFSLLMLVVATRMATNLRGPGAAVTEDVPTGPARPAPSPVARPAGSPTWHDGARLHRYVSGSDPGEHRAVAFATASTVPGAPAVTTRDATSTGDLAPAPRGASAASPGGAAAGARRITVGSTAQAVLVLLTGTGVGFLAGLFGVGGGFVIVPALVLVLGLPMAEATATSLLVISLNSAVALAMRGGLAAVDWAVVGPFTAAAVGGVLVGRRLADRVPARSLTVALVVLILLVALWTGLRGIAALV